MSNRIKFATSRDGTKIGYATLGKGPAVVLVDGALCSHEVGPTMGIAKILAKKFTVHYYDRRGRGWSQSTPLSRAIVQNEIDDLAAVIMNIGESVHIFGQSSGAILALEAAKEIGVPKIKSIVLFEPPIIADNSRAPISVSELNVVRRFIDENNRKKLLLFFFESVQMPRVFSTLLRFTPLWQKLKAMAPTLLYDFMITTQYQKGVPLSRADWESITMPTLVLDGSKSPLWMRRGVISLTSVLPNATHATLVNQTHAVKPKSITPIIASFYEGIAT